MLRLYELALQAKDRREAYERREEEHLEYERSIRRDAELKLIQELERQAGAWFRARLLHRYIRAARRALGKDYIPAKRGEERVDFFAWAQGYVDQLDPLHAAARNADLLEQYPVWHTDLEMQKGLARLSGFEGQRT